MQDYNIVYRIYFGVTLNSGDCCEGWREVRDSCLQEFDMANKYRVVVHEDADTTNDFYLESQDIKSLKLAYFEISNVIGSYGYNVNYDKVEQVITTTLDINIAETN